MAQKKGFINENLEAVLTVELTNNSQIECVLDTGFNGSFLFPRKFVEDNSMRFIGQEEVVIVEQNTTLIETALAKIGCN